MSDTAFAAVFYLFAALSVVPAIMIFVGRDVVHGAFWLLGTLAGFAGLYLMLGADFLGFTQILVYIGGILVLLLFGVMLTQRTPVLLGRTRAARAIPAGIATVALGLFLAKKLIGAPGMSRLSESLKVKGATEPGATRELGSLLLTDYILPFEIASVVLLAALVGAAYVARRGSGENP
ncbi:MAG: NADH-quinone oxidoreductase subunit J [Planctomycetales bacterium]|nr:NADH-quinone oxidoreductase subunit J [Planctomycetales bacterium]